jgi:hypothetical protein
LSNPGGPFPNNGSALPSRREQRVQTVASTRQARPHDAHNAGTRATSIVRKISTRRACPARPHTWRAQRDFSVPILLRDICGAGKEPGNPLHSHAGWIVFS